MRRVLGILGLLVAIPVAAYVGVLLIAAIAGVALVVILLALEPDFGF